MNDDNAALVARMQEALERLRDNPEWVCTCTQRPQHDPRCAVEIAQFASIPALLTHQEEAHGRRPIATIIEPFQFTARPSPQCKAKSGHSRERCRKNAQMGSANCAWHREGKVA
mgnify:CR=1 FL=1